MIIFIILIDLFFFFFSFLLRYVSALPRELLSERVQCGVTKQRMETKAYYEG